MMLRHEPNVSTWIRIAIAAAALALFAAVDRGSAQEVDKVSGEILSHRDAKLRALELSPAQRRTALERRGLDADNLFAEECALYVQTALTESEIRALGDQGITIHPTWVPPVPGTHPHGFHLATVRYDSLDAVRADSRIVRLDSTEFTDNPENDLGGIQIHIDDVHSGSPSYDGAGVRICIADTGIDLTHADFPTPLETYDMTDGTDPFTWDTNVANTVEDHGTHVSGTAVGDGSLSNGQYVGAAPGADLYFYKIGNDTTGNASKTDQIEAIERCVAVGGDIFSMSYGGFSTYMDGSDSKCQAIDAAVAAGVTVFGSAGNEADDAEHYSVSVAPGATTANFGFTVVNPSGGDPYTDEEWIRVIWRDDSPGDANLNLAVTNLGGGESLVQAFSGDSTRGTDAKRFVLTPNVPAGSSKTYNMAFENTAASGSAPLVHAFLTSGVGTFDSPDLSYTVSSTGVCDGTIAVGAWTQRESWVNYLGDSYYYASLTEDTLAPFSSRGPRVDGLMKPDIVAPGAVTISTRDSVPGLADSDFFIIDNDGLNLDGSGPADYYASRGTSMACPMVAGAAALLLEADPGKTPAQIRSALTSTASQAGAPDNSVGYGLIHVFGALNRGGCGNAILDPGEQCEDGNTTSGDGCDENCQLELDHYECYQEKELKKVCQVNLATPCNTAGDCAQAGGGICLEKFVAQDDIWEDQFHKIPLTSKKPKSLCVPVVGDPNGPGLVDPNLHFREYQAKGGRKIAERHLFRDTFGDHVIEIGQPMSVLLPTAKTVFPEEPPSSLPDGATSVDHFICYKAKHRKKTCTGGDLRTKCTSQADCEEVGGICDLGFPLQEKKPFMQELLDQFGPHTVELKKIKGVCTPAEKNDENQEPGVLDLRQPYAHFVMYQNKDPNKSEIGARVHLFNQFGPGSTLVRKHKWLLVPALKDCGNGVVDSPTEECDLPDDSACPGRCLSDYCRCPTPVCGDGVVDPGEECDDGNNDDGDGCSATCLIEFCGDGVVNNGPPGGPGEECDPPNDLTCPGQCIPPSEPGECTCLDEVGEHKCVIDSDPNSSNISIVLQAFPLPPFPLSGAIDINCGTLDGNAKAACDCTLQFLDPIDTGGAGYLCFSPGGVCPVGEIDCDGGNSLDVTLDSTHFLSDANDPNTPSPCTGNPDCGAQCTTHCTPLGAAVLNSACEGFCQGGVNNGLPCTADSDCGGGHCAGQDGTPHGTICQCECLSVAGSPSNPGGLQCNLPVNIDWESALPCGDGEVLEAWGTRCWPLTTEMVTGQMHNTNNTPGKDFPVPEFSAVGQAIDCQTLSTSTTTNLSFVSAFHFFDWPFSDMQWKISVTCQ
jgi:cysteine-rich repeat protein